MQEILKGATNQTLYFHLLDSSGNDKTGLSYTSITARYVRNRDSSTTITPATIGDPDETWGDGKFIAVDGTNCPGLYRLDVPNAAFASGADKVVIVLKGATFRTATKEIQLVNWDKQSALANSVWNALRSGHTTGGTFGEGVPITSDVQSLAEAALRTYHLDHLLAAADPGSVVANNSFWAKLHSKSATAAYSSYNNTTDSLEASRDNIGTSTHEDLHTIVDLIGNMTGYGGGLSEFLIDMHTTIFSQTIGNAALKATIENVVNTPLGDGHTVKQALRIIEAMLVGECTVDGTGLTWTFPGPNATSRAVVTVNSSHERTQVTFPND